jgi:hypothetical protein
MDNVEQCDFISISLGTVWNSAYKWKCVPTNGNVCLQTGGERGRGGSTARSEAADSQQVRAVQHLLTKDLHFIESNYATVCPSRASPLIFTKNSCRA